MASRIFRVYKVIPFHSGEGEEFSNVYRYSVPTIGTGFEADRAVALMDSLLDYERRIHADTIRFTRWESAEVTVLDGVQPIDVSGEFPPDTFGFRVASDNSSPVAPENVVMLQERVGPKRWLRKFYHHLAVGFTLSPDNIAFNWNTTSAEWDSIESAAVQISPLSFSEPDGSSGEAIYEAGNGTPSAGNFVADPRIRWHDMKY